MLLFQLSKRTAIWATIAAMVVCWLCIDYPFGALLFFAFASWPSIIERRNLTRRGFETAGVEFIAENGGGATDVAAFSPQAEASSIDDAEIWQYLEADLIPRAGLIE
jgi:hypothetical protein